MTILISCLRIFGHSPDYGGRFKTAFIDQSNNSTNPTFCFAVKKKGKPSISTFSTTSRISTQEIMNIVECLKLMKHRDSTKQNYYTVWKLFSKFCLRLDVKPKSWEDRITLFVGYLIENGKQSSTVRSYVSAVKNVLMDDGFDITEDRFLISSLTKACRITNNEVRTRLPIQRGLLIILLRQVQVKFADQPYLSILYWTVKYCLFWVGELTKGNHPVLAKNVHIGYNKRKLLFLLRSSKTHDKGSKPQIIKILSTKQKSIKSVKMSRCATNDFAETELPCPYLLLHQYARVRGPHDNDFEPFFIYRDKTPVRPTHMRNCLRTALSECGFNAMAYCTHSLRSGRSLDLLKLGLSVETIKKLGRWKSNTVFKYLRDY